MNLEDYGWYIKHGGCSFPKEELLNSETLQKALDNYLCEFFIYYSGNIVFSIANTKKSTLYCPHAKFYKIPFKSIDINILNKILNKNRFKSRIPSGN